MKKQSDGTYVRSKEDTLTKWGDPNEWMDTMYGRLMYREWCEKEIERMGEGVEIATDEETKEIALVETEKDEGKENSLQQEA